MGKYSMMRMIDSAQRRIEIGEPRTKNIQGVSRVVVEIQGLRAEIHGEEIRFPFPDMADLGAREHGAKKLTIWERLIRRPAKVGDIHTLDDAHIQVVFWTDPVLDLVFDFNNEDEKELWRECEILFLSAGFHFRIEPGLVDEESTLFRMF